jgi:hypothetical protein
MENEFAQKAKKELEQLETLHDREAAHILADGLLCQLLTHLGYTEVVEAYEKIDKWYA